MRSNVSAPTKKLRPSKGLIAGGAVFLAAAIVGAVAAQGANAELPKTQIQSQVEAGVDWSNATESFGFALPDEVKWPAGAPSLLKANEFYEAGFEDSIASFYWMCAWETSFLTSTEASDKVGAASALKALNEFAADKDVQVRLAGVGTWAKTVLEPAAAGKLDPLRADAMGLCAGFPEFGVAK